MRLSLVALISIVVCNHAIALPDSTKVFEIPGNELLQGYFPYILGDDEDENVYYIPYSRIEIAPSEQDPSVPNFSMVYLPEGMIVNMGIRLTYDQENIIPAIASIRNMNAKAKFRYLPIKEGVFIPTIRTASGINQYIGNGYDYVIPHSRPLETKNISLLIKKRDADLIMLSISQGLAIGINYEYKFTAASTSSRARVFVEWENIRDELASIPEVHGAISGSSLLNITREIQSNSVFTIDLLGGSELLEPSLRYMSNMFTQTCFTPIFQSAFSALRYDGEKCNRGSREFIFQTSPIETMTGLAGFKLPGLCLSNPEQFSYFDENDVVVKGCPTEIYGAGPMETITDLNFDDSYGSMPDPVFSFF